MTNQSLQPSIVWSIAGIDCLSGAGQSADQKAITSLGAHCCVITTALTAQNSDTVIEVNATDISLLENQWQALLAQTTPNAIKIGLIANNKQLDWLITKIQTLPRNNKPWLVFDPVTVSSSLKLLTNQNLDHHKLWQLISLVDLVTPNINEMAWLLQSNQVATSINKVTEQAKLLASTCHTSVLVTGGHLAGHESIDVFIPQNTHFPACSLKVLKRATANLRGTGCLLSSFIAGAMALNYDLLDAITLAKAKLTQAIEYSYAIGDSAGCPCPVAIDALLEHFPIVSMEQPITWQSSIKQRFEIDEKNLGLYPVIDSIQWLKSLLDKGVKTIQLRIKEPDNQVTLAAQIYEAVNLAKHHGAALYINDHWQLAIECGAYGVHLGQEDLAEADLAAIASAGLRLGISSHGLFEAIYALQFKPSYIALGHIFPTNTKNMPSKPQGLANLQAQVKLLKEQIPLVAIGGINLSNASDVLATGIESIAVVSAITKAAFPNNAYHDLVNLLNEHKEQ